MPDEPNVQPSPSQHEPKLPEQLRRQLAEADQLRADIKLLSEPEGPLEGTPQPAGSETPPPAGDVPQESWEQRARSMAGRLEQANRLNQAMSERLQALEKTVTTLQTRPQAEPAPKTYGKPKLVSEEEERDYGSDFLQVVGKRAKEEFAPEFDELADRLKRLEGRVEGVGQVIEKTQVNDIYGTLRDVVPNWREINRSVEFKQWLALPDPYSGRKRHDMLTEAFSGHDSGRVVRFFQGFLTEATGLPQGSQASTPSAPQPAGSGRPTLEDYAAPGRARSAPQGNLPPDKPMYTAAWIAKFTQDKLRGVYRGREADANAIEADIWQAQHEGRIH
jgi:hypothetical protein